MEPVERDSAAIRRTVWILLIVMLVGGVMIFLKYQEHQKREMELDERGRAPRISKLTRTFAGRCQDGVARELSALEGKVWVVAPIVPHHPAENEIVLGHMKELAERYKDEENFHLVCMSVANPNEHGYEELAKVAESVGADIDQWWFLAAEEKMVMGYLKDHLKMGHIKERKGQEAELFGKWDVPAQIRVVDQSRRVRGGHQQFDFEFTKFKEEETRKEIDANPDWADLPEAKYYLNMSQHWADRMVKVIDYTLEETDVDKDPDYISALFVLAAIILFVIIQGVRLRRRSKG